MNQVLCRSRTLFPCAVLALFFSNLGVAAEWGSIKGRFVVDGQPPQLKALNVTKDQYCMDNPPNDESVIVGEKGGLVNVAVYVRANRGEKLDVHPDYESTLSKPAVLDNKACRFVPHITLVRTGQPLVLKNSDPVGHNTNLGVFNQIIPSGGETPTKISRAAALPLSVSCNIHPFMKGYVLVQDHPYMAVTDNTGAFEINNIPAGKRQFMFWHEVPGPLKDLKIASGKMDRRGAVEVTIKAAETLDLGEIKIPVRLLSARR
jgi:hypothetical protein